MARLVSSYTQAEGEGPIRNPLRVIEGGRSEGLASGRDLSSSDETYAAALANGRPEAVELFMTRNLPVIIGLARRLLGDEAEAEDAAQEVFIKVWKNAGRWQSGQARLDSWIGRIAINHCYDRLRRKRPETPGELPDQMDGQARADLAMTGQQGQMKIRTAVASLSERQKIALELCHFQERTNIEAAEMMEISVDALESLLARGRRKLKAMLTEDAADLLDDFAKAKGDG